MSIDQKWFNEQRENILGTSSTTPDGQQTVAAKNAPAPVDERLTEQEAIEIVQRWVADDSGYDEPTTFEELVEMLQAAAEERGSTVSPSFENIVAKYAPNAPHKKDVAPKIESKPQSGSVKQSKDLSYPVELEPLIKSGIAVLESPETGPVTGHVLLHRCDKCGQFKTKCCGPTYFVTAVRDDEKTLTKFGRQAVGLDPIIPPKPPKTIDQIREEQKSTWHKQPWAYEFSGVSELQGTGEIHMLIENFLPEGITLICGLAKEGKSFLALAIAKALTSGKPLFGRRGFEVPEIVPVIYLAAESSDGALKLRCKKYGITEDKTLFLTRTLTKGPMFGLDDPNLEAAIKAMRPVIVLETLIRFNDGNDEDDATENRKLAQAIFRLIGFGARGVVGQHHSRKDLNKANPTKESAVRGSGDGLAMVDCVWLTMQDEKLYQNNTGPNEIDVVGWGRDFSPRPIRLALTKKTPDDYTGVGYGPGLVSLIDTTGQFGWIDKHRGQDLNQMVEKLVTENPAITMKDLAKRTDQKNTWGIRKALKDLGYKRGQGGNTAETIWTRDKVSEAVANVVNLAKAG
jgi:AAA domain-containing protein